MNTPPTDLISVTEMIQALEAPVTITYRRSETFLKWSVEMDDISVYDQTLGRALFRCATMWRARAEVSHAR